MLLKLGQNTSIGCKLKVLKAEPTKWSRKKVIRIKKIGGAKIAPLMSGRVKYTQSDIMIGSPQRFVLSKRSIALGYDEII